MSEKIRTPMRKLAPPCKLRINDKFPALNQSQLRISQSFNKSGNA